MTELLLSAINKNNADAVRELLESGTPVGEDLVTAAVRCGSYEIVSLLLEHNASPDIYAIAKAAVAGNTGIVKLLYEAGASLDNVLSAAVLNGHFDTVHFLVTEADVDPSEVVHDSANNIEIMKLLLRHGADPNNNAALESAVINNNIDAVRVLLEHGMTSINCTLARASTYGYIDIIRVLLDADICTDHQKSLALEDAAFQNYLDILNLLLESGADPNCHNGIVMRYALRHDNIEAVKSLITHGYDTTDTSKYTLLWATSAENLQYLIECGASTTVERALTLLRIAGGGNIEMMELYLQYCGETDLSAVLEPAVSQNRCRMVEFLLERDADIGAFNNLAVRVAVNNSYTDIIQLLVIASADHPRYRYAYDTDTLYIFDSRGTDYSNIPDCASLYGMSIWCSDATAISHDFIRNTIHRKKSALS